MKCYVMLMYLPLLQVSDIPVEVVLPVTKSDIRYFPLGSSKSTASWAIVSQVSMEYGATKINIHGMVAVRNTKILIANKLVTNFRFLLDLQPFHYENFCVSSRSE